MFNFSEDVRKPAGIFNTPLKKIVRKNIVILSANPSKGCFGTYGIPH